MTDENAIVAEAKDAAEAQLTEESFDFALAVQGRSYAEFDVPVFLDEAKVQEYIDTKLALSTAEVLIARHPEPTTEMAVELDRLQQEMEGLAKRLSGEQYTIHIKGIAPEDQMRIHDESYEKFPIEYTDVEQVYGPPLKTEVENEKRDLYFAMRLRQEHIEWVKNPKGAVDRNFENIDKVYAIVNRLPDLARQKLDEAINKSTISVDFYEALANEVF